MEVIYVLSSVVLAALLTGGFILINKLGKCERTLRTVFIAVLGAVAFYRYLVEREALNWVAGLNMTLSPGTPVPFGDNTFLTALSTVLIWFTFAAFFIIAFNEIYDYGNFRNASKFFAIPVLVLDIVFFKTYATGIVGHDAFVVFDSRIPCLVVEIAIALALAVSKIITADRTLPNKRQVLDMLKALGLMILPLMPPFVPQVLFGYADSSLKINDLTEIHRILIYFGIIIPFVIFHMFKDKQYDVKRCAMIYLLVAWMWSFLAYYTLDNVLRPWTWPLHLCNTAMFIIPLCLIFKWDKVFYFCLFINVMGAFLAMAMPNTPDSVNALAAERVIFWINHYSAFFMPIVLVALGLFKRPKFKEWLYSQAAFAGYFLFVLFLNALLTNYGHNPDFFFINSDFIVDKLGTWAERTRDVVANVNIGNVTLTFYPLYQTLFYLVYVAISAGMWFLYALLFEMWDKAEDKRLRERDFKRMQKEFKEYLGDRSADEPINGDSSPRIVLREFSKKYGANKHYSVDHASFEVKGGEIFGFLGPNGAGKSTIIKSIVGIQTITSGNIEICGFDVEKQSVQAKLNLGFVPDHYALYENLTGREYINYIADLYNVSEADRNETIERLVSRFQLTGAFDNQMKTYSHGMKQKIAIMAALVHNPKVWILDEPLTGLDPTSIFEVKECMKEHAAKGNIVFFSSHIIDVVEKICDKIAIIKKGKIRAAATVAELEARGIELEQFYLDTIYAEEDAPLVSINGDDILRIGAVDTAHTEAGVSEA